MLLIHTIRLRKTIVILVFGNECASCNSYSAVLMTKSVRVCDISKLSQALRYRRDFIVILTSSQEVFIRVY